MRLACFPNGRPRRAGECASRPLNGQESDALSCSAKGAETEHARGHVCSPFLAVLFRLIGVLAAFVTFCLLSIGGPTDRADQMPDLGLEFIWRAHGLRNVFLESVPKTQAQAVNRHADSTR